MAHKQGSSIVVRGGYPKLPTRAHQCADYDYQEEEGTRACL